MGRIIQPSELSVRSRDLRVATRKLVFKLIAVAVFMFGFGFALVPLYRVFCDLTGLNGKVEGPAQFTATGVIDTTRRVKIQFLARTADGMPWEFYPMERSVEMSPGETKTIYYYAKNPTAHKIVGQAVPSITPGLGAKHFLKTECFCFRKQPLEAGEVKKMAVIFTLAPELPKDYNTLTLSYTLYNLSKI